MHIKKLFLEMIFILAIVSCVVITINNFEVHRNAQQNLLKIQAQYLGATYEIYRNEMIGDILIGNKNITQSLINEISNTRKVGVILQYNNQELHSNQYHHQKPFISYDLNLGNKEFSELKLFPLDAAKKFYFFRDFFILFFLEILILSFGFIFLLKRFNEKLFLPLKEIFINVSNNTIPRLSLNKNTIIELQELADTLKLMHNDIQKKAKFEAEAQAARQLAHDIRSPLASLNLLLSFISELPEKPRVLMRSSINRITDIANSLQNKGEEAHLASSELCNKTKIAMISSAVESVVTEKRLQLINNKKIYIDSYLENAYGLFSNLDSTELKRVLSNLINNSFESFDDAVHHISINIFCKNEYIFIELIDDGRGISPTLLKQIGT
ncbi:MAG: Sensor protein, partial [uncultured bacterium]